MRMPRSQRMTFSLPLAMMYSALISSSFNGAGQAPLEKDGLVRLAQFLEQVKVLRVPGAHLDHIHLLKQGQVSDIS